MEALVAQFELPSLIFVSLTTLALGALVFYRKRTGASSLLFLLLSFSFTVWAIANYFSLHPPVGSDLFWIRAVLVTAAPQAALFALLMHTFPSKTLRMKTRTLLLALVLLGVQMVLAMTPLVFSHVEIVQGDVVPVPGPAMPVFGLILLGFFLTGINILLHRYRHAKGQERHNQGIILTGFAIMIVLLMGFLFFAVILFGNTTFIPVSPLFVLPFIVSIGYTLTRAKFLNIQLVATEFITSLLAIILLTEALLSDGLFRIFWKSAFAVSIAALGVLLIQSVHREIKQRKELARLTKRLKSANKKLKELDDLKTEFLSIASHQLRTPLSIIKGYTSLMEEGAYGKMSKGALEVLTNIDVSNERLIKLVDEFLNISRIEQGRTKYSFAETNVVAMAEGVVTELKEKAGPKQIEIALEPQELLPTITSDEEKIRHCLYNFVDNAIKYSPEGSTIRVYLEKDSNGVQARVVDAGAGLDKKDLKNLFQKFYRSPHVMRDVQGTGLGLYVVKQFAEAHGGRVWSKSDGVGKGSEFGFWLPQMPTGSIYTKWVAEQQKSEAEAETPKA